ncbi:transcriptional repressor [Nocardia sp. BSTN01]|nr:transcriptional repressor [Nocardia sp. BSTN01]
MLALLSREDRFWTPQQIYAELRTYTVPIAPSTVYRILHRLDELQQVETMRSEDGELLYRIGGREERHHNLVCRRCGHAERFTLEALDQQAVRLGRQFGYTDIECRFDIYGICGNCRNCPSEADFHAGPAALGRQGGKSTSAPLGLPLQHRSIWNLPVPERRRKRGLLEASADEPVCASGAEGKGRYPDANSADQV